MLGLINLILKISLCSNCVVTDDLSEQFYDLNHRKEIKSDSTLLTKNIKIKCMLL